MNKLNRKLLMLNGLAMLFIGGFAFSTIENDSSYPPQNQTLSIQQAKTMHQNYGSTATQLNDKLQAVFIDRQTISDMNALLVRDQNSAGVRVYFGKDQEGNATNILVNTKKGSNADDISFILKSAGKVNVCPNFCDTESGLMQE